MTADDGEGVHAYHLDHAGTSASIVKGVQATNKLRHCSVLWVATPAQQIKVGNSSGCAAVRIASNDDGGGRAGRWNHVDAPTLITKDEGTTHESRTEAGREESKWDRSTGRRRVTWGELILHS